jgi:hypothetical protein
MIVIRHQQIDSDPAGVPRPAPLVLRRAEFGHEQRQAALDDLRCMVIAGIEIAACAGLGAAVGLLWSLA